MKEIEFWNRNKKGEVVPQTVPLELNTKLIDAEIRKYKSMLDREKDKKLQKVFTGTIEALEKMREEKLEKINITFTPMLNYETKNVAMPKIEGKFIGCEGLPVMDQDADICFNHCKDPSHDLQKWIDMKDSDFKHQIANLIYRNSFPEKSKIREEIEELKKKILNQTETL